MRIIKRGEGLPYHSHLRKKKRRRRKKKNLFATTAANRHTSATDYNEQSSRSHTIFQMIIESRERGESSSANLISPAKNGKSAGKVQVSILVGGNPLNWMLCYLFFFFLLFFFSGWLIRCAPLQNLIDLAGSEKVTTNIDRKREGGFINRSLLTLGTVIAKISEGKGFAFFL